MPHDFWFWTPLTCDSCGQEFPPQRAELTVAGLNPQFHDRWVHPGEVMAITHADLAGVLPALRDLGDDSALRAVLGWACPTQAIAQWAMLECSVLAAGIRFDRAYTVSLTVDVLARAHHLDPDLPRLATEFPAGPLRMAILAHPAERADHFTKKG